MSNKEVEGRQEKYLENGESVLGNLFSQKTPPPIEWIRKEWGLDPFPDSVRSIPDVWLEPDGSLNREAMRDLMEAGVSICAVVGKLKPSS